MKFESQQFRENLASELTAASKEERKEILESAKETPEYWQARTEKIKERQEEEEIDEGFGILVKKKTLYHGSGTNEIKQFTKAEEDTVGSGVYFTSEAKDAIGYARRRAKSIKDASPVLYESSVENVKLLDLRKNENVRRALDGFKDVLAQKLHDKNLPYYVPGLLQKLIDKISSGKVGAGNLRDVAFHTGQWFSDYVKSLGYEGLVTFEGGEGIDIGNHDTYLIFDPEKVEINKEQKIALVTETPQTDSEKNLRKAA